MTKDKLHRSSGTEAGGTNDLQTGGGVRRGKSPICTIGTATRNAYSSTGEKYQYK